MDTASKKLTRTRYESIDDTAESYTRVAVDKFFDDQIALAELLIENAILRGAYSPQTKEQNGRMNSLVLEQSVEEQRVAEVPEAERVQWDPVKVTLVAENVMGLSGLMKAFLYKKYSGLPEADREDVIAVAAMRFIERVNDGRLPETIAENPVHLEKLFTRFVGYAAIDAIRNKLGRQGQKQLPLSLDQKNEDGGTLKDTLSDTLDAEQGLVINNENVSTIKELMPHLNARERRTLVLRGYFELNSYDIALILGTTEGTITQTFRSLKEKVDKLMAKG